MADRCRPRTAAFLWFGLIWLAGCATAPEARHPKVPGIDAQLLESIEAQHGAAARQRVEAWRWLIEAAQGEPEQTRLVRVNDFFNRLEFVDDDVHWGVQDYWATPVETLATNGGDCEDFTIAKYFTLSELGIPEERLRLTYVKALSINKAHMVLTYQGAEPEPLVLDNLAPAILPVSQRPDLLPVYSFNASGLWITRQRGEGERVGDSRGLSRWQDLLRRINAEKSP